MLSKGDIVSYFYLWARESAEGEESGRKARPTCVVVRDEKSERLFLFPITSQMPAAGTPGLAISEMECRRSGLIYPCWIICDEYNVVQPHLLHDFESLQALGRFSPGFFELFKSEVKEAAKTQRLRAVTRT